MSKKNLLLMKAYELGYRATEEGKIISPSGKELKLMESGYLCFSVWDKGKSKKINVHRFVAYQKFGPKIFDKTIDVRHLDNNPLNNNFINIEIGTRSDNERDKPLEVRINAAKIANLHGRVAKSGLKQTAATR